MKQFFLSIVTASILWLLAPGNDEVFAQGMNSATPAPANLVDDVFADYFQIQNLLAQDSLAGVAAEAQEIASLVNRDTSGAFRPELAAQAEALASAQDLPSARQIFKSVSGYLIQSWQSGHGPGGAIHEMRSPADNVDWLQRGDRIENPYDGKACPQCGVLVK